MKMLLRKICLVPFFPVIMVVSGVASASAPVRLAAPEVFKADWNTRSLVAEDIDGDGKTDLLLVNNDTAKIDILYQREPGASKRLRKQSIREDSWEPHLSDARFEADAIVSGVGVYAVAALDWDGDGLVDVAYTGNETPLVMRYQDEAGQWEERDSFDEFDAVAVPGSLQVGDLDRDGKLDLAVLSDGRISVFWGEGARGLNSPTVIRLPYSQVQSLRLVDVNGDNLEDLVYISRGSSLPLRARLQTAARRFGPETGYDFELVGSAFSVLGEANGSQPLALALVEARTGLVRFGDIARSDARSWLERESLSPEIYSVATNDESAVVYAGADFNQDGRLDIVATDGASARLLFFAQTENGNWEQPVAFPTLDQVSQIAVGPAVNGKPSLLLLSQDEAYFGLSELSEDGRFSFPRALELGVDFEVFATGAFGEAEAMSPGLVLAETGEGGASSKQKITLWNWSEASSSYQLAKEMVGEEALGRTQLEGLLPGDFNQDGRMDLLVLYGRAPARFFVQTESGTFAEAAADSSIREKLFRRTEKNQLGWFDIDGDGPAELVVGKKGFARAVRIEGDEIVVVDQFNARRPEDELSIPLAVDIEADGQPELIFYEGRSGTLQLLRRDENDVMRYERSWGIGEVEPLFIGVGDGARLVSGLSQDAVEAGDGPLLMFNAGTFWRIGRNEPQWKLEKSFGFETDLEGVSFNQIASGDLNSDGQPEVLLLDGSNHVIEILRADGEGGWLSTLHFTVFDENRYYRGRKGAPSEPREILIEDVTSDGKPDLILLVHDRVLVFPQL